jgi:hypothetical protein
VHKEEKAEIRVMQTQAKHHWWPLEAGRSKDRLSPRIPIRGLVLATSGFQPSETDIKLLVPITMRK